MFMENIKCPACGAEVAAGTENCPACGAPISAITDENISGIPIDNRAAIDTMLQSASRLVEQSASLGVDIDEPEENTENGENSESFQRTDANSLPPELSDNQKNAMSGGVINLTPGNPPLNNGVAGKGNPPAPTGNGAALPPNVGLPPTIGVPNGTGRAGEAGQAGGAPTGENAPGITLFEMDDNGNAVAPSSKEKKAKKDKPKKPKSSPAVIAAAVIVSLAVGLAGGFFGKKLLFPDFPAPDCQSFAEKAVSSVEKVTPEGKKLYIAEAYVKDFTTSRQCIFRAFSGEGDSTVSEWYRVKVDSDNSQTIHVYLQLTEEEYNRLLNSDDSEERVRASVLKGIQNETDRCVAEAKKGEWDSANVTLLNNLLNPYTPSEKKTEGTTAKN